MPSVPSTRCCSHLCITLFCLESHAVFFGGDPLGLEMCMSCRAVAQPETLNLEPYILNFQREELEKSFHAVKSALAISQASRDDVAKRHEEQVKALEEDNERLRCRIASLEADVGEGQRAQLASEDAWEERSSRLTDRVSALTAELEATKSDRDAAIADAEEIAQVRSIYGRMHP